MSSRRYPFADLVTVSRFTWTQIQKRGNVSGREIMRYRNEGMSPIVASRLANVCGLHPCEVWPSWFDDTVEDSGRACQECGARFLPNAPNQRYCSAPCKKRANGRTYARRRYHRDPEWAERTRARRRQLYIDSHEYERARERERYQRRKQAS